MPESCPGKGGRRRLSDVNRRCSKISKEYGVTDCLYTSILATHLLPLDRRRRLAADVVDHARYAADLVDDAIGDAAEEVVRQVCPVCGHEIDGFHRAQRDHPLVGACVADHADRLHRQAHRERRSEEHTSELQYPMRTSYDV